MLSDLLWGQVIVEISDPHDLNCKRKRTSGSARKTAPAARHNLTLTSARRTARLAMQI